MKVRIFHDFLWGKWWGKIRWFKKLQEFQKIQKGEKFYLTNEHLFSKSGAKHTYLTNFEIKGIRYDHKTNYKILYKELQECW